MSQIELQTQLLGSQASDHSLFPHLDQDIGIVLNPYMGESTWMTPAGGRGYPINSIGLRGEEIAKKPQGLTRIVLVGDSVVFGWKLDDEERIGSVLSDLVAERLKSENVEIVTVALPGWNVVSERAFLENHLSTLQPDIILWSLLRNDLEDVLGVIPPGMQARWNSSQKQGQIPFSVSTDFHKELAMPILLDRWDSNLTSIQSMEDEYGVPIVMLKGGARGGPFFEMIVRRNQIRLPIVTVPAEFLEDKESWCVSETDCHPSPSAARIIALGLLDKLVRLGWLGDVPFEPGEKEVAEKFRAEEERVVSAEEVRSFSEAQFARVPTRWVTGDDKTALSVLYGLNSETGEISKNGVLFLRDANRSSLLYLDLDTPPNPLRYPRSVDFRVRNQDGVGFKRTVQIVEQRMEIGLALPKAENETVYELAWQFDYADCSGPTHCTSGTVQEAGFRD